MVLYTFQKAVSILSPEFSAVIPAFVFVHGTFFTDKFVVIVEHIFFRLYDTSVGQLDFVGVISRTCPHL